MSAASVSLLVVGAGRSTILRLSAEAAMVPAGTGCGVATEGGYAARPVAVEGGTGIIGSGTSVSQVGGAGILRTGAAVSRVGVELIEAVMEAVLFGAECSHLAGEVSDLLPKCGVVRGLTTVASEGKD